MLIDRTEIELALPGYEIGGQIGRGGFGLVFTARHRRLGATRAVKVIVTEDTDGPEPLRRFLAEAQLMTELDHPHLVRVFEYAEYGTVRLLVMEYLPGGTLTQRLSRPIPAPQACAWALAIADGLQAAHEHGVAHRDVKPDNVLFTADGLVKVSDFGIAKLFEGTAASASGLLGTPLYMAPEQFLGAPVGPASDLYSLGATVYRTLAGRAPFESNLSLAAVMRHHLQEPPAPLTGAPPHVAAVVLRALAKDPADRQSSAREFASELAKAAREDFGRGWISTAGVPLRVDPSILLDETPPATAAPDSQPEVATVLGADAQRTTRNVKRPALPRLGAPRRRRPWLIAASGLAVLVLVLGAGYLGAVVARHSDDHGALPHASATSPPVASDARLVRTFTGHTDTIYGALFDPAHNQLISAGKDRSLRFWDVTSGKQIGPARPSQHGEVYGLALSGNGRVLAAADDDGTVQLWDPATRKRRGDALAGSGDSVNAIASNHDGSRLATAGHDKTVRIWDTTTGKQVGPALTGHTASVSWVAFNPTGTMVASVSVDRTVRLWDVASGKQIGAPMTGHTGEIWSVAFSPDGNRLATGSEDKTVRLWDVATRKQIGSPLIGHTEPVSSVAFSPDGTLLASVGSDQALGLWNPNTGASINLVATDHKFTVYVVAFSPDSTQLVTAGSDNTVKLWKLV